ncbi:carbohydrate ABC transporter permease, partial [Vreelandella boliviensis]
MNTTTSSNAKNSKTYAPRPRYVSVPSLETVAAWLLAVIWVFPLLYAFWAAFHPSEFMVNFSIFAPLTLENFTDAWSQAPFARYYLNTFALVTGVVIGQFIVCTLAAFAFARFPIPGKNVLFMLVLIQLFVFPEVLIVENYRIASELGLINTITGIGLPYVASALGIFLLRQTFKTIPRELEDAARIEGCNWLEILW